ncbi:MAG: nitroreductase [Pseudomonadota bacterium]
MQDGLVTPLASQDETDIALDMLLSRASISPATMTEPGPEGHDLNDILDAAMRAPDHGRLRPWRFLTISGDARHRLGEVFVTALQNREPGAADVLVERERSRPLRAPLVIAAGVHVDADNAIPEIEQVLSAGAATMNILNAAHALGFAAMWVTGKNSYDPIVNKALGFHAPDRLIGFVYLGTPKEAAKPIQRPLREDFVRDWSGQDGSA